MKIAINVVAISKDAPTVNSLVITEILVLCVKRAVQGHILMLAHVLFVIFLIVSSVAKVHFAHGAVKTLR